MKIDSNATHLSCFALISAIESDLREIVLEGMTAVGQPEFLSPDMRELAIDRARKDERIIDGQHTNDFDLLVYLDFGHLAQLIASYRGKLPNVPGNADALPRGLTPLMKIRNRVCHSRPLEFDDFAHLHDFSEEVVSGDDVKWPNLKATLRRLKSTPGYVLSLSIPTFWADSETTIYNNLPAADFEDTGFIGRRKDIDAVIKMLLGAYPVISILGEGGVGKTSLALRSLYELLESDGKDRFDAIVWISLKTSVLTTSGIFELRDAITDTLGLFRSAAKALGVPAPEKQEMAQLLSEVRDYINEFKVLLAFDNLETIARDEILDFLKDLPGSSKVLITSRIGLGQLEFPYPLAPMDAKDSAQFMRRTALLQNQNLIAKAAATSVDRWCNALNNNPLAIRWFVASVALGKTTEELLYRGGKSYQDLLRFSFQNLYESLSEAAHTIIAVLHAIGRATSRTEIMVVLEQLGEHLTADDIDMAIRHLISASIIRRKTLHTHKEGTEYFLGDFATQYLQYVAKPQKTLLARIQSAVRTLKAAREESISGAHHYSYELQSVEWHTPDERIVSARLRQALDKMRRRAFTEALAIVDSAQILLPEYSEVRRIRAMVLAQLGNLIGAEEEFAAALDLRDESNLVRYNYAWFCISDSGDFDRALEIIEPVVRQKPADVPPRSLKALALMRSKRLREAADLYEQLLLEIERQVENIAPRHRRSLYDQAIEVYRRLGEREITSREPTLFIRHVVRALAVGHLAYVHGCVDDKLNLRVGKVIDEWMRGAMVLNDKSIVRALVDTLGGYQSEWQFETDFSLPIAQFRSFLSGEQELLARFESLAVVQAQSHRPILGRVSARFYGKILRLSPGHTYGFILDEDGREWFFHLAALSVRSSGRLVSVGARVDFARGENSKGPCAIDVNLHEGIAASVPSADHE
jgi:LuxR family transcriptional regulator, glucitol operon activator